MKFATAKAGETFSELAHRLYRTSNRSDLGRVVERLTAANPKLRAEATLGADVMVAVPEVEGVETTHDAQNERAVLLPLLDQIRAQVGDLEAALAPALERQAKAERATIDIAGLAEVKKLAKREKVVKAKLEAVVEAAHKRTKELEAQARLQNRVAKEFAQDLDELFVNLGRGVSFFRD